MIDRNGLLHQFISSFSTRHHYQAMTETDPAMIIEEKNLYHVIFLDGE